MLIIVLLLVVCWILGPRTLHGSGGSKQRIWVESKMVFEWIFSLIGMYLPVIASVNNITAYFSLRRKLFSYYMCESYDITTLVLMGRSYCKNFVNKFILCINLKKFRKVEDIESIVINVPRNLVYSGVLLYYTVMIPLCKSNIIQWMCVVTAHCSKIIFVDIINMQKCILHVALSCLSKSIITLACVLLGITTIFFCGKSNTFLGKHCLVIVVLALLFLPTAGASSTRIDVEKEMSKSIPEEVVPPQQSDQLTRILAELESLRLENKALKEKNAKKKANKRKRATMGKPGQPVGEKSLSNVTPSGHSVSSEEETLQGADPMLVEMPFKVTNPSSTPASVSSSKHKSIVTNTGKTDDGVETVTVAAHDLDAYIHHLVSEHDAAKKAKKKEKVNSTSKSLRGV